MGRFGKSMVMPFFWHLIEAIVRKDSQKWPIFGHNFKRLMTKKAGIVVYLYILTEKPVIFFRCKNKMIQKKIIYSRNKWSINSGGIAQFLKLDILKSSSTRLKISSWNLRLLLLWPSYRLISFIESFVLHKCQ